MVDHIFGAEHTELKLSTVEAYLRAYTKALRRIFDELWYIDAFAGTGSRVVKHDAQPRGLLHEAVPARIERLRGSAQIALDVTPRFDRLIFIEKRKGFADELEKIRGKHSNRRITVIHGDANAAIRNIVRDNNWSDKRAVLFLDPYGMEVDWKTLKAVADTRAIDVWYLFSLSGFYRQATRQFSDIDDDKRAALNRTFGSDSWMEDLYPRERMRTLTDEVRTIRRQRPRNVRVLEGYVKDRLQTIFSTVLDPLRLPRSGPPRYSLFLCISSRSEKAISVASRIGNHILKAGISS
jgi:three-Cys-motif partner protein